MRKVWAKKGQRPILPHRTKYQWLYAYSFVEPLSGRSEWLLLPTVSIAAMNIAIEAFGQQMNPHRDKIIILLIDQAGFHTGKDILLPEGIVLFPLPPYTPELQPAECLWPLLREPIANDTPDSLDTLERILVERCQWLMENESVVKGAAGFSWICDALKNSD
jgi:hypothetical protein